MSGLKKENGTISPLSEYSTIVKEIGGIRQKRLYVLPEEKNNAKNKLIKEGLLWANLQLEMPQNLSIWSIC